MTTIEEHFDRHFDDDLLAEMYGDRLPYADGEDFFLDNGAAFWRQPQMKGKTMSLTYEEMLENKRTTIMTPEFRVSFPSVFKANAYDADSKAKFEVTMLFPRNEADLSEMTMLAKATRERFFGANPPKKLRSPFRDGDEKETPGYEGMITVKASSIQMPQVINEQKLLITGNPNAESQFYAGCYAIATVTCYGYDKKGNKGVSFGLSNLMKTRDGEPFSGRGTADSDFADIEAIGGGEDDPLNFESESGSAGGKNKDPLDFG